MTNGDPNSTDRWSKFTKTLKDPFVLFSSLGIIIFLAIVFGIYRAGGELLITLKDNETARGLITFLVVFATVAIAIILTLYSIVSESEDLKERFGFGKEILTALIGVLGTILGFYFGTSIQQKTAELPKLGQVTQSALQVAPPFLSKESLKKGEKFVLSSFISGGKAPYVYSISFDPPDIIAPINKRTSLDGIIREEIKVPDTIQKDTKVTFQIETVDSIGKSYSYNNISSRILLTVN